MKRYLPFVIILAVLLIALIAGYLMLRSGRQETVELPAPNSTPAAQAAGAPRSSVTIEEYGDYQCPPCGVLHPELKKLKEEYGDRLRFSFHHFPLTQIHKNALEASHAAAAAGLQGKFWEMHDLIYQNQAIWSDVSDPRPIMIGFARQAGLNIDRFRHDIDGAEVDAIVSADSRRAQLLKVTGTPTVFIDGQMIKFENTTLDGLRKEIDGRLAGRLQ